MRRYRILAIILAIIASAWGVFCALFALFGDRLAAIEMFGIGYIVAAGYIWRAISAPPVACRRAIWGLSATVQGCWLAWGILALMHDGWRNTVFDVITNGWWLFAFVVSAYAVVRDVDETHQSHSKENKHVGRESNNESSTHVTDRSAKDIKVLQPPAAGPEAGEAGDIHSFRRTCGTLDLDQRP